MGALYEGVRVSKIVLTSNKNYILDVGMEKNRNKNWDGGYLYYPFLHSTVYCVLATHIMLFHALLWNMASYFTNDMPVFHEPKASENTAYE